MSAPNAQLFKASSISELESKKRRAEAPKRKSYVRTAATAGDAHAVLEFLETIEDPAEATELARDAHKYLSRYRHTAGVRLLERDCDGLFGDAPNTGPGRSDSRPATADAVGAAGAGPGRASGPAVQYDHATAQILTGKIGSIMLHVDRGVNLPVKDGTAGSSDPFVRVILWEKKDGVRRRAADVSTQIKLMTLNPVFDENFVLHVGTPESDLELSVYDWDEDGTHDFMGCVTIPLREFIEDLVRQRDNTYRQNLAAARAVSQTAGSLNIAGRSLGGTAVKPVNQYYGTDTEFGRVGWDDAVGIKALATGVQRSSELPELRPKLHHAELTSIGGGKSAEGGSLMFTVTFVPAFRPKAIANVPMFPSKSFEHITPMTPANQLVFEDKEFLHSSVAEDATWAKSRTLTDDVLWPKEHATSKSSVETSLIMRRQLAHLTWRNMIEPTRPYKQPLPAGVCKDPKTGLDEIEEKAIVTRREDGDSALRMADRLWGQQGKEDKKLSLNQRLQRAAGRALDAKAYRTRADATKLIGKAQALFEEYKYLDAIARFEDALRIATDGKDRQMMAASHKWLGDSWQLVGDFRKARDHHAKHLQFNSADVVDLSGEGGLRNKAQVLALCRQETLKGPAVNYVLNSVAKTSIDQQLDGEMKFEPKRLELAVQEAKSYHDVKYWSNRANVRLDRVNWSEGASRLTMDVVRDAIHDMKRERAGELKPVYVKPSMWGELRF